MNLELIKNVTEDVTGMNIKRNDRKRDVVIARYIYFNLAKELTGKTMTSIGKVVGRNHATVLHGIRVLNDWMETSREVRDIYTRVKDQLVSKTDENGFNNTVAYYWEENKRLNNVILNLVKSNQLLREKVYGKHHTRAIEEAEKEVQEL